jgi:membrane protein
MPTIIEINKPLHRIEHVLFETTPTLRITRLALRFLRYPYALAHDMARGDLQLRAMGLVYTTLLSIVPLLALVFSVLKGLGYHRNLQPLLLQFLEPMGNKGVELTAQIMRFVDNARGDVLGSLGVAFLLYTAISMIQKVEESFNTVWRVAEPRSIARRISEYLSVLMVGPTLIVAALGLMATLGNNRAVRAITSVEPLGTLLAWLGNITPYILVMCVFTFLYGFVPNTKVRFRAALIGGVVAGFLWVGSGLLFASFVSGANSTLLIYAGFAIVILALIWLHISWLILLVGAQLAFYVQHPQCLRPGSSREHLTASLSERLALSIMYLVAEDFTHDNTQHKRQHYTLNSLAERLFLAVTTLAPLIRRLEAAGLILVTDNDRYVPGRDLATITLIDILDAVRNDRGDHALKHIRSIPAADAIAATATQAMRDSLNGTTLKELITKDA